MKKALLLFGLLISVTSGFGQPPKLVLPIGHTGPVNSVEFSPDGKKIVTASKDNTIKLWDAISGILLVDIKGHSDEVNFAKFTMDGKKIISGSKDGYAKIWDASTGELIESYWHQYGVSTAALNKNSTKFITGTSDGTYCYGEVKVFDLELNSLSYSISEVGGCIKHIEFNPEDSTKILVLTENSSQIHVFEINDYFAKYLFSLKGHSHWVHSAIFSPDGKKIVTASRDKTTKIWDAQTGELLANLAENSNGVNSATFSPDSKKIVTASWNNTAKIWDAATGNIILDLKGHKNGVLSAKFSPDGKKIITTSSDNTAKIWDTSTGEIIADLNKHTGEIRAVHFSFDCKKIATASNDNTAIIWDALTGKLLFNLTGFTKAIKYAQFSPSENRIIITDDINYKMVNLVSGKIEENLKTRKSKEGSYSELVDNSQKLITVDEEIIDTLWDNSNKTYRSFSLRKKLKINIWNTSNGTLISESELNTYGFNRLFFSPDGTRFLAIDNKNDKVTANIFTTNVCKLQTVLKGILEEASFVSFSPDNKIIITYNFDRKSINIWNALTGLYVKNITFNQTLKNILISPDSKTLAIVFSDLTIKLWNLSNGTFKLKLKSSEINPEFSLEYYIENLRFSPNSKKIMYKEWKVFSNYQNTRVFDAITGDLLYNFNDETNSINSMEFNPSGNFIITTSKNNSMVNIWDDLTGELKYYFTIVDSLDCFIQIKSGFYKCSQNAAKLLHYVTKDLKVITFEQLDVKYNRPDKVLEAIGCTDTALINSYRKAYFKRIKKLGIDTTSFRGGYSVPESDFENRDVIEYEQKNDKLTIRIKGVDSTYKLDRFNIWVNEIPLFGQKGFNIKKRNRNNLDTNITIQLSQGENRIETSVLNVNGTESYRMPLQVNYSPEIKSKEKLHFIGIGIDKFADTTYNLQYSVKDIRDLSKKLKEKFGDGVSIDTLFNENVTIAKVKALKKKLLQTSINDKVIISYSGHGLLSKEYDYYLSTYSVNFEKPQINGLPYDELENLLDSIPARKKLMLIDACHSGEVDKDEVFAMNNTADSMGLSKPKGGKTINSKSNQQLGLKNSFELMQSLFVNVGKSTGATIISAAAGNQFALERGNLKNGVFTYCILEAMKNNSTMTVSQLKSAVGKRVVELTNGLQKPTSRNETINSDWSVW